MVFENSENHEFCDRYLSEKALLKHTMDFKDFINTNSIGHYPHEEQRTHWLPSIDREKQFELILNASFNYSTRNREPINSFNYDTDLLGDQLSICNSDNTFESCFEKFNVTGSGFGLAEDQDVPCFFGHD